MFESFTDRERRALVLAQEEARLLNHGFIGTEHLLLGLIHEEEGIAAQTSPLTCTPSRRPILRTRTSRPLTLIENGVGKLWNTDPTYDSGVTTLADVVGIGSQDGFLAVVSTLRSNGTIQSSVVNAGVLAHPVSGVDVVGFVTCGKTKLANLRSRPQVSVTFRAGWKWAAVEGQAELFGPRDTNAGIDGERLRLLLREVFIAAGGTHDDWDAYDRTMTEQGRTVVLVSPSRLYSN